MRNISCCIVNLDDEKFPIDLKTPIFRVFEFEHFLSDIEEKRLTLVNVQKWIDVNEAALFRSSWSDDQGCAIQKENSLLKLFGLSWTLDGNCAGHWLGFSPSKNVVRIRVKTTLETLLQAVNFEKLGSNGAVLRAGKVGYLADNEFCNLWDGGIKISELSTLANWMKKGLLLKRDAYAYEREVRFMLYADNSGADDLFHCDLIKPPKETYETIEISPYVCDCCKNHIRRKLRAFFAENQICDSSLGKILVDGVEVGL